MNAGEWSLIIETSNPGSGAGEVGLARGRGLERAARLDPKGRHDDALMPAIAGMCAEAGVRPAHLGMVLVSVGPGGFSSVRIAVATAKMIALATGAVTVPVPSCRSVACGSGVEGTVLVVMAGKRTGDVETAWVRRYEVTSGRAEPLGPGWLTGADGLAGGRGEFGAIIADAHLPGSMRTWAGRGGVPIATASFSAASCLAAGEGLSPVPALELAPVYPREPEAVRQWRSLHG